MIALTILFGIFCFIGFMLMVGGEGVLQKLGGFLIFVGNASLAAMTIIYWTVTLIGGIVLVLAGWVIFCVTVSPSNKKKTDQQDAAPKETDHSTAAKKKSKAPLILTLCGLGAAAAAVLFFTVILPVIKNSKCSKTAVAICAEHGLTDVAAKTEDREVRLSSEQFIALSDEEKVTVLVDLARNDAWSATDLDKSRPLYGRKLGFENGEITYHLYTDNKGSMLSLRLGDDFICYAPGTRSTYSEFYHFSNDYGTLDTVCAHTGCDSYIALRGDTNCCPYHSNKCGNCGCYIDEDAMYCMDCISGYFGN